MAANVSPLIRKLVGSNGSGADGVCSVTWFAPNGNSVASPFRSPRDLTTALMPARLDAVLTVIYLVFNEGYSATSGEALVRTDLCVEAIRLGRLIRSLMAPQPPEEATGLLALMLLHAVCWPGGAREESNKLG